MRAFRLLFVLLTLAFAAFAADFMKTYVAANNKASEREAKACILKHHLLPAFGGIRCDEIRMHAIETLKAEKLSAGLTRKRVNNLLACLGKILRYAHEMEVLAGVPKIKLLRSAAPEAIQELPGHSTLAITMRYMHLAPIALRQAIELLDFGQPVGSGEKAAS